MIHYSEFKIDTNMAMVRKKRFRRSTVRYYNVPMSFDIETTSFYDSEGRKQAYCYMWQMCINGTAVYGRTLDEFRDFIRTLQRRLGLSDERRIVVYVHLLAYEFQFIRKYFEWQDVFAREKREPMYAVTGGVEFRCSYMLSLLSLENLAKDINAPVKKLVGCLDYSLPRNSLTPLSERELAYCENDVLILNYYILGEIERNQNDITKIPLTKTGYVRRECRDALKADTVYWKRYRRKLDRSQPDADLFTLLFKAYQGGYTHANMRYIDLTLSNVRSVDFASSYPFSMVSKKYPYKFHRYEVRNKEDFESMIRRYCCVFEVAFENLQPLSTTTILSSSKCEVIENAIIDNGRVLKADYVLTYCTELDWENLNRFYKWDAFTIGAFYWSKGDYLPEPLVRVVLERYKDKTELKGVVGQEDKYRNAKGIINGIYGMTVTNPLNPQITYDADEWGSEVVNVDEALRALVTKENTFLLYQWGVYVSAYSRNALVQFVADIEDHVVYCDTDSIKYIADAGIDKKIEEYNRNIIAINKDICEKYSYVMPTTSDGKTAWLGVFDRDGDYGEFKTLGAKRYMYRDNSGIHITVSGLNKKKGAEYIAQQDEPFNFFNSEGMHIPAGYTGKQTFTYIDEAYEGILVDYQGRVQHITSPSSIHLCEQDFNLSVAPDFKRLFNTVQIVSRTGKSINGGVHDMLSVGITDRINAIKGSCGIKTFSKTNGGKSSEE